MLDMDERIVPAREAYVEVHPCFNGVLPKLLEAFYHILDLALVTLVEGINKAD